LTSNLRSRIRHLSEQRGIVRQASSIRVLNKDEARGRTGWRFVAAGLLLLLCALLGAGRCGGKDLCEVFYSSHSLTSFLKTPQMAADAEKQLQRDASDVEALMELLDYYECHWEEPEYQDPRTRLILWTIQNDPHLRGHDDRDLFINPDDKGAYAQARSLWLEQVERYPYFPDVLANAARCLKLTDGAEAGKWLKRMDDYDRVVLAEVYADAIAGVTGENPLGGVTSVDAAERHSAFAKYALEDAGNDAELAARTGWQLHLLSNEFRYEIMDSADFDPSAERLLLKSVELSYPEPVDFSYLDAFYDSQMLKPADKRVLCKAKVVHKAPEEQAARFVSGPRAHVASTSLAEAVKVTVDILVGVDGHVWEAVARGALPDKVNQAAADAVRSFVYLPLKLDGQLVRVTSRVDVTVEPRRAVDKRKQGITPG
jgi:hypothetical protein